MENNFEFDESTMSAIYLLNNKLYMACALDKEQAITYAEKNNFAIVWMQILTLLKEFGLLTEGSERAFCELIDYTFFDEEEQNYLEFDDEVFRDTQEKENMNDVE